jgi:hypothetical protein
MKNAYNIQQSDHAALFADPQKPDARANARRANAQGRHGRLLLFVSNYADGGLPIPLKSRQIKLN